MAIQGYSTVASRNLIAAERAMLKHAMPISVLESFGMQKEQPTRKTDTIVFRRVQPFNMQANGAPLIESSALALAEGVNPTANTISYSDVSVTVQQFGILFSYTSKAELMYEDDIPGDMVKITGQTMAECAEMIRYGQLKGGTSVAYVNGSTRVGVNTKINLNTLRRVARALESARAMRMTSALKPGVNFDTKAIEPSYLVFHHTDVNADIRDLPDFTRVERYGSGRMIHAREIGAVEEFRFISSPLFRPFLAAGAAVGSTGMKAADATNLDVYPVLVMAEDCFGQVALKGRGAVEPTVLPATQKTHSNPLGQFGFVGASFWMNAVRLNENWMYRIETAVSSLA